MIKKIKKYIKNKVKKFKQRLKAELVKSRFVFKDIYKVRFNAYLHFIKGQFPLGASVSYQRTSKALNLQVLVICYRIGVDIGVAD